MECLEKGGVLSIFLESVDLANGREELGIRTLEISDLRRTNKPLYVAILYSFFIHD